MSQSLNSFRTWFYAAAIYNVLWGAAVILAPTEIARFLGVGDLNYSPLLQCIGMMVLVLAIGYWLVGRDPQRYGAFAVIGLVGKVLGPIGFLWAYSRGELPLRFGLTILTNDVIWLPAFALFVLRMCVRNR